MATLSFLWHLHQPAYRTADGVVHAPWVALHAGGAYTTLAAAIEEAGGRGQVINIVPTLLEQLVAYRDGCAHDPLVEALSVPGEALDEEGRHRLVRWSGHLNARHLERSPRLHQLTSETASARADRRRTSSLRPEVIRDLQVLLILAHAGDRAWRDHRLEPLAVKGLQFSAADHEVAAAWLRSQPFELIERWRRVAGQPGVEIATSPFAHPIVPLLIDTAVVRTSWSPQPAPEVPPFSHPEDARRQLGDGLEFMRRHGFAPRGCWPPEGAVSEAALGVFADAGVAWLVTDEGILERSLGRPVRDGGRSAADLYRPWRFAGRPPALLFRDRRLSDRIGFELGRWQDEEAAADDLVRELLDLARRLPRDGAIVIALDGENPWPHYPAAGGVFLRRLMSRINQAGRELEPATLTEVLVGSRPGRLARVHPGSWIHGSFATWIGHPEKNAAWERLAAVRHAVASAADPPPLLRLAEGSDWMWWLGDDNPTALAPLYDSIFRRHLADACAQAGVRPPVDLSRPIKSGT